MISPEKVKYYAKKNEKKNLKFRSYLKRVADEDELDLQFLKLHEELFAEYDCKKCLNCCTMFHGEIPKYELEKDAKKLNMSKEDFIAKYLKENEYGKYNTISKPCDFLQEDGECMLGECKPENCKNYPYTNQPERLFSLYSVLDAISVCPVAYEIFERLKEIYCFR